MKYKTGGGNRLQEYNQENGEYCNENDFDLYRDKNGNYDFPDYLLHDESYAEFYLKNCFSPSNIFINSQKANNYLLKHLEKNDKSKLILNLGYSLDNYKELILDIMNNTSFSDIKLSCFSEYTYTFICNTNLIDYNNNKRFNCYSVWQVDDKNSAHFVTLIFKKEKKHGN